MDSTMVDSSSVKAQASAPSVSHVTLPTGLPLTRSLADVYGVFFRSLVFDRPLIPSVRISC